VLQKFKEREAKIWYEDVKVGRNRYIWRKGVLLWGLSMFVVMALVVPLVMGTTAVEYQSSNLAIDAIIWLIGGAVYGYLVWRSNIRKFGASPRQRDDS